MYPHNLCVQLGWKPLAENWVYIAGRMQDGGQELNPENCPGTEL